ncbi:uncharacterized protein [Procambarus clarkii]|uniref:uncharacterized protein n=1 Tax=Procambarus clarkii TaxID=6728 RepID=UPI003744559B
MKIAHDQHAKEQFIKVGDIVLVKKKKEGKLDMPYDTKPYKIIHESQRHVTRQLNKCDQLVQSGAIAKVLENLIETAKQRLQRTNEAADDYLRVLMQQNAEPDQLDTFHAEMEKFEEGSQDHLNRLTQSLEKLQSNSVSQNTLTTSETNKQETFQEVRLPTIDLAHFHEGEAKAVVEHLIPSDKDYDTAIQLLEVNYSNKEIAIANLYYKLRAIPTPDTTPEALQEFRLQVESLIKALGVKADVPKAEWVLKLEIQSRLLKEILASIFSHYRTDTLSLDEIFEVLRITVNRLRAHKKIISDTDKSTTDKLVKSKVPPNSLISLKPLLPLRDGRILQCHQGQHHSALCGGDRPISPKLLVEQDTSTIVQFCKVRQGVKVLNTKSRNNAVLPTAQLRLNSKNSRITTRDLFDQGSQRAFITQQAANQLKLKPLSKVTLNISGFLADTGPQEFEVVQPLVRLGGYVRPVKVIVVNHIPLDMNVKGLRDTAKFLQKNRIKLADSKIKSDHLTNVDLLVGADHYYKFITGTTSQHGMNLLNSAGGCLLTGTVLNLRKPMPADNQH